MNVLLISTYELGHQPFGLASPAAWIAQRGHNVACFDLSVECLDNDTVREADLVAFYLPMHTATRLAAKVVEKVRTLNPAAHVCCYGLYAPLNESYLRSLGAGTVLGGEFELGLASLVDRIASGSASVQTEQLISIERLQFQIPLRSELPPLEKYARLRIGSASKQVGYAEASRGCKHLCRHCPVVPVYNGSFRVVQPEIVLADIRQQVDAGAEHVTFGDPDFFNGPTHALRIMDALHREWPALTYDTTIKIEHLLKHRDLLPHLRDTGCLFVTSAVESVDDSVLAKLDKGHTRAHFIEAARLMRSAGLTLSPTFIPFTPWTTRESYRELLKTLVDLDLVDHVAPVQLALRLLIPRGSRLLELDDIQAVLAEFDEPALLYRWQHPDPAVDALAAEAMRIAASQGARREIFSYLWNLVHERPLPQSFLETPVPAIPQLDEPWYCCAEPTEEQLAQV
ncbi:MAG TPA: CUAEP/CCAEP-tail radical SAM protein [Bryobacteraceae bacterium]|nr:CUAEP/CCAEP-tail radical SAM protein [Bryobacteraceae bacterium]